MFDMLEALRKNAPYMAVREGIPDCFSGFYELYKIRQAQRFQLMGDRGFCHSEEYRQIADAHPAV